MIVPGLAVSLLVATATDVFVVDPDDGSMTRATGLDDCFPTSLASDPHVPGRAWCGTRRSGVFRSDDGGASWTPSTGVRDATDARDTLHGRQIMALAASPARQDLVWAGTEPSEVWRSEDGGRRWQRTRDLETLPSSPRWAFPPRPDTHHVRWIACHPSQPGRLWAAIEAGALIATDDGGINWRDRVPGGPFDTHELAIHPDAPETLRVAAGDGYFESHDSGLSWTTPRDGLDVGYLRSVAIDPERPHVVVVSGASGPRSTYMAGHSDGRVYRREGPVGERGSDERGGGERGDGERGGGERGGGERGDVGPGDRGPGDGERWQRVLAGWPDPPRTIAPLIIAGTDGLWAADERGVHRSDDAGVSWHRVAAFPTTPSNLRGLATGQPPRR